MLFILIALISLLLQFFLPWWIIGPVACILAAWKARGKTHAFSSAFFAIFLMWACVALFKTIPNDNLLANRIGQMLRLPNLSINWIIVLLATCIIGGLTAGVSAVAGLYWRRAFSITPVKQHKVEA